MVCGCQTTRHNLNKCWPRSSMSHGVTAPHEVNTLRPRQNGRHFADDTFKRIFLNENIRISTRNSLKFVPKGLINNIQALVLIMAWRRPGDKPLSEPMLVRSLKHICVTRPQWVKNVIFFPVWSETSVTIWTTVCVPNTITWFNFYSFFCLLNVIMHMVLVFYFTINLL